MSFCLTTHDELTATLHCQQMSFATIQSDSQGSHDNQLPNLIPSA